MHQCSSVLMLELKYFNLIPLNFNSDGILVCIFFFLTHPFWILKGKGASLGVGRGRAVAMRAKVSPLHLVFCTSVVYFLDPF